MLYGYEQKQPHRDRLLGSVSSCVVKDSELTSRTVIIWKDFKKAIKIEGHQQAVWAVKFIGEDRVLTGELYRAVLPAS
jgi:hypothetical protein